MSEGTKTLYERLGGYNAIAAVAGDLLSRLRADPQLGRFWAHRGEHRHPPVMRQRLGRGNGAASCALAASKA
jgi:truncated hemoglobin YjbI